MSKRSLLILVGLFALLLLLVSLPVIKTYLPTSPNPTLLTDLPEEITKITITQSTNEPLELARSNGLWQISGYKADQDKVSSLLTSLQDTRIDSLVSSNKDKFASYGASDSAVKLQVEGGGQEMELLVGLPGIQPDTLYLRSAEGNEVYLVKSRLTDNLFYSISEWRDKTIANLDLSTTQEIILTRGREIIMLRPGESEQWQAVRGNDTRIVGELALDRFVEAISPLIGTGFAIDDQRQLFDRLKSGGVSVEIKSSSGADSQLLTLVEDKANSAWIVKTNTSDEYYLVNSTSVMAIVDNIFALYQ